MMDKIRKNVCGKTKYSCDIFFVLTRNLTQDDTHRPVYFDKPFSGHVRVRIRLEQMGRKTENDKVFEKYLNGALTFFLLFYECTSES